MNSKIIHSLIIGSSEAAGIKTLILNKDDQPFVRNLGVNVLPGTHALIGIEISEVTHLTA